MTELNSVFDCRVKDVIHSYEMSDSGDYLVRLDNDITPKYDDFLITKNGDVMVFDYVDGKCGRLLDINMIIGTKTPSYRKLKRAVLSQLKRSCK